MKVQELIDRLKLLPSDSRVYIRMVSPHFGTETHRIDAIREEVRKSPNPALRPELTPTDIILEWVY